MKTASSTSCDTAKGSSDWVRAIVWRGATFEGLRDRDDEQKVEAGLWLLTHPDPRHAPRIRALLDHLAEEITAQRTLTDGTEGGG
jgi:DNA-binding transcriptional LysR family regulator